MTTGARWVGACAHRALVCAVVAGVGVAAMGLTLARAASSGRRAAVELATGGPARAPFGAWLVMRPADCLTHAELLRMFERPDVRGATALSGILMIGGPAQVSAAARLVRHEFPSVRIERASLAHRRLLAELNWRHTPLLLVFERASRTLRLASPVPFDAAQRGGLLQMLRTLRNAPHDPRDLPEP